MPQLRLKTDGPESGGHGGEVFALAFTPDGAFVLSGGWDGHLRLWDAKTGTQVTALRSSAKAVAACAVSPDGRHWLSGGLDGMLTTWDAATHQQVAAVLAHTRPISGIQFSPDGRSLATPSWDRTIGVWDRRRDREGRSLAGHGDIVAGCHFTPDGHHLFSWSHDGTARVWDLAGGRPAVTLEGHADRVTAGAVSPDGQWAATGSRDRVLRLWNLPTERPEHAVCLGGEVRACFFLLDGESLVTIDAVGRVVLHAVPDLTAQQELATGLPVQCAELAPGGGTVALGCDDGRVRFVALDGYEAAPLVVMPTEVARPTQSRLGRLFGRPSVRPALSCTCPVCRHPFEVSDKSLGQPAACPRCARTLRVSRVARAASAGGTA